MHKPTIIFHERNYPSANMVVIIDEVCMLVDSGFGSDVFLTDKLVEKSGVKSEEIQIIVNTHYHSDHVGGNHYFQKKFGTKIATHKWEAELVNRCDEEACTAEWLDQPVEPYVVNMKLSDGDEINTGKYTFQVLHTPGHTLGHISLFEPEEQLLIVGDLFHNHDVGWINQFREGVASIERSLESLDRISNLNIQKVYSGHGTAITDPMQAIDSARRRFDSFLKAPEKLAWHAVKRIFAFTLMIKNGLKKDALKPYLLNCGWFCDFARYSFHIEPDQFVQVLLDEMIRCKGAYWRGEYLLPTAPFEPPANDWIKKNIKPKDWQISIF